jgi:hypothetical protein
MLKLEGHFGQDLNTVLISKLEAFGGDRDAGHSDVELERGCQHRRY